MRIYRAGWFFLVGALGAPGAALELLVRPPAAVVLVAVCGAALGSLGYVAAHHAVRGFAPSRDRAGAAAVICAGCWLAVAGWVEVLGGLAAGLLAVLLLGGLPWVRAGNDRVRSLPRPPITGPAQHPAAPDVAGAAPAGAPVARDATGLPPAAEVGVAVDQDRFAAVINGQFDGPGPPPAARAEPGDSLLAALSTAELCQAWQRSYLALQQADPPARRAIAATRQRYLDELERRGGDRFTRWIRTAGAASDPASFLTD